MHNGGLWKRREILKQLAVASAAMVAPGAAEAAAKAATAPDGTAASGAERASERTTADFTIQVRSISPHTCRISVLPIVDGRALDVPTNGSLLERFWGAPTATWRSSSLRAETVKCGELSVSLEVNPLIVNVANAAGAIVQSLAIDQNSGTVSFDAGKAPLLGLGEGGAQFDRRGSVDPMVSGQGGYRLATHGGRVPIPWLVGTSGWAIYFNQPFGTFDLTAARAKFQATNADALLPLDMFVVASTEPATILAEYARLTGHPEMPPLWSLGYQQSHRTLASEEEVLGEAKKFREKKLPCDALIYLGTGFCPSGWNTENGSFVWNERVFPNPKRALDELHAQNFRAVVHVVILSDKLEGSAHDPCDVTRYDEIRAGCHWDAHRKDFAMGVDGWWPDEGDPLNIASRLTRNRMYWEGPQIDRPNERPYALHRNGYAGMQRYASFLWSGDVYSTWETLKTHIPIAVNTGLTGIPLWGTDIGGFVPTKEFTAELYLRWFQFGAFCPLFRSHGRTWKLRLPWGWNLGDASPVEVRNYDGAATPETSELHNTTVEPICRKYLELRYKMLPYLYSAVRESALSGLPVMRALWIHYPDDATAVARDDEYLWGRDILVAPVVEKGATSRRVYLPKGGWFDFWTNERIEGGREIERAVDLETMPIYVREGAILPMGPVRQFAMERVDEPTTLAVYPGRDGSASLYEDDGSSFRHRHGEWMGVRLEWKDSSRVLTMTLEPGSKMLSGARSRNFEVRVGDKKKIVEFRGARVEVKV